MADRLFVITGSPGSGKTTLIKELKKRGIFCIEEAARKVIQDDIALGGNALPGENIGQRIEKMLICSIEAYQDAVKKDRIAIFDRGVLDYLGYASHTNTPIRDELRCSALSLGYNRKVFVLPPWEEIYCHDNERKQSFEEAVNVYHFCSKVYSDHGYEVVELPKTNVETRAVFIINSVGGPQLQWPGV